MRVSFLFSLIIVLSGIALKARAQQDELGLVLVHAECLNSESSDLPPWVQALWVKSAQTLPPGMRSRSLSFSLREVNGFDIQKAAQSSCVIGIDRNDRVSTAAAPRLNDSLLEKQLYLPYIGFETHRQIYSAPFLKNFSPVVVAVVDTGIDSFHPEFIGRLWSDDAGSSGYNFIDGNFNVEDDSGHGSHVAGLIAARSANGQGIAGLSQNARIMTLKALDSNGDGTAGDVGDAIRYAADQGAKVINLSLSIEANPASLEHAIDYALSKGAFIVAASGNRGIQITASQFISPAGLASARAGMISVGSVDSDSGQRSDFSNYSTEYVEMAAPGSHGMSHILSTFKNGRYASLAGTSMAAPLVSGAVAELMGFLAGEGITLSLAELESFVLDHSVSNPTLTSTIQSGRQLDLEVLSKGVLKNFKIPADGGFDE